MDPHKFDGIIRQLSQIRSRRALVGGSLGAAVLAAIDVGEDALGKQVDAEHKRCLATGKRCGYTRKKKNGKDVHRPCKRCCQHHSVERTDGKRECACRPTETECSSSAECCSGVCGNGVCQFGQCAELGQACDQSGRGDDRTPCCDVAGDAFPICNQTGDAAGTCVQCLGTGAPCDFDALIILCCEVCVPINDQDPAAGGTCGPRPILT